MLASMTRRERCREEARTSLRASKTTAQADVDRPCGASGEIHQALIAVATVLGRRYSSIKIPAGDGGNDSACGPIKQALGEQLLEMSNMNAQPAGRVQSSRFAALLKLPSSYTAARYRICRRSIKAPASSLPAQTPHEAQGAADRRYTHT
jgi:hypothetical protein